MTALRDDCFRTGEDGLMPLDEALRRLDERLATVALIERVPLRAALGRLLAADLAATVDVPPHDNSAVDGYAVFFDDLAADAPTRLPVTGRVAAGHPFTGQARRGEALRIFTGAPMPAGPDTVLMQEDLGREGDMVVIPPGARRGANRREAGEDIRRGQVVLRAGARLRPQEIGVAAAIGCTTLEVRQPLRVAVFSTGDEVKSPGAPLAAGQIYDSNRFTIAALVEGLGCTVTDLGILPDRLEAIRDALGAAAARHELLITSGGVSMGEEDHVKAAVEAQGSLHFWRLAIKPGRPVALGQVAGTPFVGLPGNPVAVMITFLLIARRVLLRLSGAAAVEPRRYPLPAAFSFRKKPGRREFLRGRLVGGDGGPAVERFGADGSGILSSMTQADGLIEIADDVAAIAPGDSVAFLPFAEVLR